MSAASFMDLPDIERGGDNRQQLFHRQIFAFVQELSVFLYQCKRNGNIIPTKLANDEPPSDQS